MKKSLVLAMAMALGVSATAFAANPFSDVPAGHWAYASVAKLAAAGIVDGYPDGTFKGDNLMTRYEMAQIVAKAYAKGAIGADDKLMAEFADELDNLGVRVAKLEKKSDNVKITGEARFGYKDMEYTTRGFFTTRKDKDYSAQLRSRLYLSGAINDNWTYGAMLENTQSLDTNAQESKTDFRRAFVKGDLGNYTKITAGRQAFTIGSGYVADLTGDAVKVDFGKVLKGTVFYGRFDTGVADTLYNHNGDVLFPRFPAFAATADKADTYGLALSYDFGNFYTRAAYYNTENSYRPYGLFFLPVTEQSRDIYTVGLGYKLDSNLDVYAEYLKASEAYKFATAAGTMSDDGWAATLKYKGVKPADRGSWGAYVSYYDQAGATMIDHITEFDNALFEQGGIKGYEIGADYAMAKNIIGSVSYYDFESKDFPNLDSHNMLWSRVTFTF